jgi:tetratricopeptide (TPR) repeat protein
MDLDPASLPVNMTQGVVLYFARRYEQAIARFQSVEKLKPGFPFAPVHLALAYVGTEKKMEALSIAEDPDLAAKLPAQSKWLLALVYAAAGRRSDAQRIASESEEQARHSYVSPFGRAEVQAALGNDARALELLQQAYSVRDCDFLFVQVDPELDSLRTAPRFQELLRMANF